MGKAGLGDRYLAKTGFDSQMADEPEDRTRQNNLFRPALGSSFFLPVLRPLVNDRGICWERNAVQVDDISVDNQLDISCVARFLFQGRLRKRERHRIDRRPGPVSCVAERAAWRCRKVAIDARRRELKLREFV